MVPAVEVAAVLVAVTLLSRCPTVALRDILWVARPTCMRPWVMAVVATLPSLVMASLPLLRVCYIFVMQSIKLMLSSGFVQPGYGYPDPAQQQQMPAGQQVPPQQPPPQAGPQY